MIAATVTADDNIDATVDATSEATASAANKKDSSEPEPLSLLDVSLGDSAHHCHLKKMLLGEPFSK